MVLVKIDLHVHTTASACSVFSPKELVDLATKMNVKVVVTTNHHDSYKEANFLKRAFSSKGILYFPALEMSTRWGDFLFFGEDLSDFQGYFTEFPTHLLPRDDVAVVWAHPYRFMHEKEVDSIKEEVALYIDAIEGINGNCLWDNPDANQKAQHLAKMLNKPITGGSDAHSSYMFFKVWTEFFSPVNSYLDFVHSLKRGMVKGGTSL